MPTKATLDKYGISAEEWQNMFNSQGGACAICGQVPSTGRLNIDHFHVKGWSKLDPQERKKYVRSLLCYVCNHRILTRGITVEKLRRAADYLEKWENDRK